MVGAYRGGDEGRPRRLRLSYRGPNELVDLDEGRVVGLSKLVEHVRRGGRFEAIGEDSGDDCTLLVLAHMLEVAVPKAASGGLMDLFTRPGGG